MRRECRPSGMRRQKAKAFTAETLRTQRKAEKEEQQTTSVASERARQRKTADASRRVRRGLLCREGYFDGCQSSTKAPMSGSFNITARPSFTFWMPPSDTVLAPSAFAAA